MYLFLIQDGATNLKKCEFLDLINSIESTSCNSKFDCMWQSGSTKRLLTPISLAIYNYYCNYEFQKWSWIFNIHCLSFYWRYGHVLHPPTWHPLGPYVPTVTSQCNVCEPCGASMVFDWTIADVWFCHYCVSKAKNCFKLWIVAAILVYVYDMLRIYQIYIFIHFMANNDILLMYVCLLPIIYYWLSSSEQLLC